MTVTIMKATIFDHGEIAILLKKWLDETAIKYFPKECGYSGVWLADLIARQLVYIARLGEKLIGCTALRLGYLPWNNEVPVLFNDFLMTDKEHRDSGVAKKLIEACKSFAREKKLMLMVGHFSGVAPELKDRFIKMHGFVYSGSNFIYNGE